MPVVGTAGHVDHGKSALVAALTGTDPDRLPEEKARGMTTDLGFARFVEGGESIGVIDVPGHERYIRNMVAGAWGVDGALLVVAADDGWMEQTGRHAEVLRALGAPILALAITKADLVEPERAASAAADACARLAALYGPGEPEPPWLAVDSLRGRGIAELRSLLATSLGRLAESGRPTSSPSRGAYLFVDRSFALRGSGLVVAGSLRGGPLSLGQELLRLPSGEALRVRSLQSYGAEVEAAAPGSRVAIGLSRPKREIGRGDCLCAPGAGILELRSAYLALDPRYAGFKPRAGLAAEAACGSAYRELRIWPARTPGFLRVAAEEPFAAYEGQPIIILRKGGADILAAGFLLAEGGGEREERSRLEAALSEAAAALGVLPASPCQHELPFDGILRAFKLELAGCLELATGAAPIPRAEAAGAWAFSPRRWASVAAALKEASLEAGGLPAASLPSRLGLPAAACAAALARLGPELALRLEGGNLVSAKGLPELPRSALELAERLDLADRGGLDEAAEGGKGLRRELELLCKRGRAVSLDGRLFLSAKAYRALAEAALGSRPAGAELSLQEAKAATGLSRKWIIPLLNRMERDGLLRRKGEIRLVLKGIGGEGSGLRPMSE
ncbi:MAG TPA: SelB C-terminal domain-containing protein [Spirochaetia bacterium]|nr:SelB C-terminal domain-containing protein [Spirochaetia bacterium]